jgi:hypothetical protein
MARLGRIGWACSDGYKLLGGLLLKKSVLQIVLRRDRFFGPLKQFVEINRAAIAVMKATVRDA